MEDLQDQGVSQRQGQAAATVRYGEENESIKRRRSAGLNRLKKRKRTLYITLGLLLFAVVLSGTSLLMYTRDQHTIAEGVTISGINVGNLTQIQAKQTIDKETQRLLSQTVKLNVGQQAPEVKLEDLGLALTSDAALEKAYAISRTGSVLDKISSRIKARNGVNMDLSQKWDDQKLKDGIDLTLKGFVSPATDASFDITNQNTMNIKKETVGSTFDSEALIAQIKAINIYKPVAEIKVEFKEQLPQLTAVQLEDQKITGLIASYTTRFDPSQSERTENVLVATKALDKTVIKPGDTFSFNNIVGERTVAGGYKDAYIIVDGKFVPGLGGGICQVSSTLYNAGLLANLSVVQRSNHDLAISYVPLGQDATVAYPDLDLKFNNNSGAYLLIRTRTTSDTITIELYGKVKPGQDVTITNSTESIIPVEEQRLVDQTLPHGASILKQQGHPGSIVKSVRTVKLNGKVVSSEPLKQSRYLAMPTIYSVGP